MAEARSPHLLNATSTAQTKAHTIKVRHIDTAILFGLDEAQALQIVANTAPTAVEMLCGQFLKGDIFNPPMLSGGIDQALPQKPVKVMTQKGSRYPTCRIFFSRIPIPVPRG